MHLLIALTAHETAHLLSAILLKIKFHKVKITLFGFNFDADLENIMFVKKMVLFLSGPLMNFCLYIIFADTAYDYFANINIFLCIVNLIPIVPLDGGNICKTILEIFLDMNSVCRYIIMTNTFFMVCFMVIIYIYKNYLYFLLVVMALKGILEENRCLTEKIIRNNYAVIRMGNRGRRMHG
ncbi:site-2 protease family protein [Sedimentibacter sp.]|uniref:site-2 protease family protein n=1 Tax=Sedimentibacter sp. TaxID=1960295 RepID=UPI00289EF3AD|nr:site-2 protease family protein [Sedimentibacter sp.]